jgi:hypothetical protein
MNHDGHDLYYDREANIPVRIGGATAMLTLEQYEIWRKENEHGVE